MSYVESCHEPCLVAAVVRLLAADARREEMIREHYRRRREYIDVVEPRNREHRRRYAQQYGRDPVPMGSESKHPEDDYACRYSGFTSDGAMQIRIREGMLRTGQIEQVCMVASAIESAS